MSDELSISKEETIIGASESVSTVNVSAPKITVVPTELFNNINLIQEPTSVSVTKSETTTVNLQENITSIITDSPNITGAINAAGNISVPYLSSFKSETILNGITQGFSFGLTDSTTTTLQCIGDNSQLGDNHTFALNSYNINLDGRNISIDASSTLELVGDRTNIYCQLASLKLGNEKNQNGLDLGARLSSYGSPYTGIFVIENNSRPSTAESRCPFIILEGKIDNAQHPYGSTKEFMHIGIDNTGGSNYSNRNPIIVNPTGFGLRLAYSSNSSFSGLHPVDEDGAVDDNRHSLGNQYARWATAYLASNPIVGSDKSLKQDIENLDDAERRVAVSCKSLLKKYRLRQSVEAKGDDARIHVGIIAQDLQQAFIDEGLDPTRYAMFCSDTAYEHEGNIYSQEDAPEDAVAVTRLSVRYEQLLAFIISAL